MKDTDSEPDSAAEDMSGPNEVTKRLLDAAVVVFAQAGFEAARVAEIARRAGLTTGAIYARWPGKRDLLRAAIEHATPWRHLAESSTTDMSGSEVLGAMGKDLVVTPRAASHDVALEAFVSARRDEAFRGIVSQSLNEGVEKIAAIVSKGKGDGSIDASLSTASIVTICQAVSLGMHLVTATEIEGRRLPTSDEWDPIVERLIGAITPRGSEHFGDPSD